jgi:hypothetical protein
VNPLLGEGVHFFPRLHFFHNRGQPAHDAFNGHGDDADKDALTSFAC